MPAGAGVITNSILRLILHVLMKLTDPLNE